MVSFKLKKIDRLRDNLQQKSAKLTAANTVLQSLQTALNAIQAEKIAPVGTAAASAYHTALTKKNADKAAFDTKKALAVNTLTAFKGRVTAITPAVVARTTTHLTGLLGSLNASATEADIDNIIASGLSDATFTEMRADIPDTAINVSDFDTFKNTMRTQVGEIKTPAHDHDASLTAFSIEENDVNARERNAQKAVDKQKTVTDGIEDSVDSLGNKHFVETKAQQVATSYKGRTRFISRKARKVITQWHNEALALEQQTSGTSTFNLGVGPQTVNLKIDEAVPPTAAGGTAATNTTNITFNDAFGGNKPEAVLTGALTDASIILTFRATAKDFGRRIAIDTTRDSAMTPAQQTTLALRMIAIAEHLREQKIIKTRVTEAKGIKSVSKFVRDNQVEYDAILQDLRNSGPAGPRVRPSTPLHTRAMNKAGAAIGSIKAVFGY